VVGPSYVDIANKYAELIRISPIYLEKLLKEVQCLGKFTNGAHSSLNKDEAKSMVKYILSLKK
jgi:cytochrome c